MGKIIIGIAGESGSGKDTATRYLAEKYGASHHKFSAMLRDILDRLNVEQNRKNIDLISTTLRHAFGEDIMSRVICHDVESDTHELIVMDGVRRESDLMCVRSLPGFVLWFVDTSLETRYNRITSRRENADDHTKTFEEFVEESKSEPQQRIQDLKGIADFVIDNNGTLEQLQGQIDDIMFHFTNNHE